jgi:hypothetical protein
MTTVAVADARTADLAPAGRSLPATAVDVAPLLVSTELDRSAGLVELDVAPVAAFNPAGRSDVDGVSIEVRTVPFEPTGRSWVADESIDSLENVLKPDG